MLALSYINRHDASLADARDDAIFSQARQGTKEYFVNSWLISTFSCAQSSLAEYKYGRC
jgi:hypothetical protein